MIITLLFLKPILKEGCIHTTLTLTCTHTHAKRGEGEVEEERTTVENQQCQFGKRNLARGQKSYEYSAVESKEKGNKHEYKPHQLVINSLTKPSWIWS